MCQLHATTLHLKPLRSKRSTHEITQKETLEITHEITPNPPLSLNNIYNFDARPWPKNTILIAGDSMINGINEKRISTDVLVEPR